MKKEIKILCVEDDFDIRSNIAEILRDEGYEVFEAENGKMGFEKFLEVEPDLVISDVMMPDYDGFYLLSQIRHQKELHNHVVPFIFLSALGQKEQILHGLESLANDYLIKPVDFDLLISKVREKTRNSDLINLHYQRNIDNIHRQIADFLPFELDVYLNQILQQIENLRSQPHGKLEEEYVKRIEEIYLQAMRMKAAIHHNLDGETIKNRMNNKEELADIYEIFETTIAAFEKIASYQIELEKPYSQQEMPKIRIDKKAINLALFNLLSLVGSKDLVKNLRISFLIDHFEQLVAIFYLEPSEIAFSVCVNQQEIAKILDSQNCKFELIPNRQNTAILIIPSYRLVI